MLHEAERQILETAARVLGDITDAKVSLKHLDGGLWGGESAAAKLAEYLKPAVAKIYVKAR